MGTFGYEDIKKIRNSIYEQTQKLYIKNQNCSNVQELKNKIDKRFLSENCQYYINNYNLIENLFEDYKNYWIKEFEKKILQQELKNDLEKENRLKSLVNQYEDKVKSLENKYVEKVKSFEYKDLEKENQLKYLVNKDIQKDNQLKYFSNEFYEIKNQIRNLENENLLKENKIRYLENKNKEKENKLKYFEKEIKDKYNIQRELDETKRYMNRVKINEDINLKAKIRENEQLKKYLVEQQKKMELLSKQKMEEIKRKNDVNHIIIKSLRDQISQNKEEKKKLAKESEENLEKEIKKMEEINENKLKDLQLKFNKELDKKKKEHLLKEQNKLRDLNRNKNRIIKDFKNNVNSLKQKKTEEILKNFQENEKDFCLNDISIVGKNDISNFIAKLFKSEDLMYTIIYHLKHFTKQFKNKIPNVEHLNIILVGPTGVGKSTLINAILKVNAKTNFGKPVTQKIENFESNEIPFIRLIDSKGIEKKQESGIKETFKILQDFIKAQIDTNDPDKFIHCIWYCWKGTRLEDCEFEFLKELSQQYSSETIPIIIVYTNAVDEDEIIEAKKYILNEFNMNSDYFVPVLAKEKKLKSGPVLPYNLDKLNEISIEKAKGAIKSSCYEGFFEEIKKKTKKTLEKLMKQIKDKIDFKVENIISKMSSDSKIEDLHKETKDIIIDIFYQYYFLSSEVIVNKYNNFSCKLGGLNYTISDLTKSIIEEFVVQFYQKIINIYQTKLNEFIETYSKELTNEILNFQNDFSQKNNNLLEVKWTSNELEKSVQNYLYEKISKIFELIILKNSFMFIVTPLIQQFRELFEKSYLSLMNHEDFKNSTNEIIKISYDKIEIKIKEYNELAKKKNKIMKMKKTKKVKILPH